MLSAALKEMSGLKEVTGLFDSRAWGTAVLPTLFAAALAGGAAIGLASINGQAGELQTWWNSIEDFGRGVVLTTGIVCVLAAGIVVANIQFSIIRFWEGYSAGGTAGWLLWPTRPVFAIAQYFAEWDRRSRRSREQAMVNVLNEAEEIDRVLRQPDAWTGTNRAQALIANGIAELFKDAFLKSASYRTLIWSSPDSSAKQALQAICSCTGWSGDENLIRFSYRGRMMLSEAHPLATDPAVKPRYDELREFLQGLSKVATGRNAVVLADLAWKTYQYTPIPPEPGLPDEPLLPTRLGRAIRAAEAHPLGRYGLDAVLTWPRLAPLLPKEFSDRFAAAESALALTCTLVTFVLVVGLPLVVAAMLVALFGAAPTAARWCLAIAPLPAILILFALTYRAAADAAEAYAEQIRSAFDLYRWKALEQMGFKLPPSPKDEKETWRKLTHWLLDNARSPADLYLSYVKKETAYSSPPPTTIKIPVPTTNLAIGYTLAAADLAERQVDPATLGPGVVTAVEMLIGRTLTAAVVSGAVIPIGAVVQDAALVPLTVQAAAIAGLELKPGHAVTVAGMPPPALAGTAAVPVSQSGLIVMSVTSPTTGAATAIVIVAAPATVIDKIAQITASERIVIARGP